MNDLSGVIFRDAGRTRVSLEWNWMGKGLVVRLYNENPHIGAVAIGDYDQASGRVSVSVITRLGHKEDGVASHAAHNIAKSIKNPVCVIAGIHIDDAAIDELQEIEAACKSLVEDAIKHISVG